MPGILLLVAAAAMPARAPAASPPPADAAVMQGMTAREILDRVDDLWRGGSSHSRMTMSVRTKHWARELTLEAWTEGKEKSLIRILAPRKERGTATLKVGGDIWNYLPKVKRVIKLPSSMMGDAWMGSHFTNDDLVKDSRMADDYRYEISFRGKRDGTEVVEVVCTPRPEAAVVWGKILVRMRVSDLMPLRMEYFDEDMKPARAMAFSDFREMGGRTLPAVVVIVPADKPKEETRLVYHEIGFDVPLEKGFFSLRNLQR